MRGKLRALLELTRPHTIVGTTLAVVALYVVAAATIGRHDGLLLAEVLLASLAVNVYVVALNQLTDVEIDRINKPYLPLAAGTLRPQTVLAIVLACAVLCFGVAALVGRTLVFTIGAIFFIGSAYSLEPFRFKRSPFFAAASITVARAVVLNLGVYLTFSKALAGRAMLPASVLLFVAFLFAFVVVIALMKDVPDVDGDRKNRIATLVIRLGARRTLLLCRFILTVGYAAMIAAAVAGVPGVHSGFLALVHGSALTALWIAGRRLDPRDNTAVYRHYMFIWKLFYLELAAFPIICLLARPFA